jgi:hypothetical protein
MIGRGSIESVQSRLHRQLELGSICRTRQPVWLEGALIGRWKGASIGRGMLFRLPCFSNYDRSVYFIFIT